MLVLRRGFDLGQGFASSAYLFDDFVGVGVPLEGFRVGVAVADPGLDRFDECRDAGEGPSTQPAVGQFLEPPFHQVKPGAARWREVQVPAGLARLRQPLGDLRSFVR